MSNLRKEYEQKVIELAREYILKMQPLVIQERIENDDINGNIELDQLGIASVIDEYFEQGFSVEKVLKAETPREFVKPSGKPQQFKKPIRGVEVQTDE